MNAPLPEAVRRALAEVTLDDKWTLDRGRAYMSGTQALIRLTMLQRQRDLLTGLNTAGFISGYRGSPLGGVDQTAWKAKKHLERHHVKFQPGLNEDLAATSVWGTQQVNMFEGPKYDGVFAMWYGKGPGVDRCGDVFKHANAAGTSRHGGVLALAGDDHGAKSSTLPHQSDHIFKACMMPVLFPATVQEYLDMGLHGFAMSRYAGVWVGMKTVTEVVEASASVIVDPERVDIVLPSDFAMPAGGLNIRWPDGALEMEARLLDYKLYAALAYCRANRLNYTAIDSPHARFGIVASGKAYLDTRQALSDLGLDEQTCKDIGIRLFKCGMVWPLEAQTIGAFAEGLEEILVVEEKRQMLEYQVKEELFNWVGKPDKQPLYRLGLKSFFEEGRSLAQISHPSVVSVLNFFRENETVYMVMNYLQGDTLQDFIVTARELKRDKVFRESTIRSLFDEILRGLRIVHQHKMLHLDIKPANIFVTNDNKAVMLDFGAAREVLNKESNFIRPMYTPGFAAPEMYRRDGTLGPWTDIYAIGACIYACMQGYPPNDAPQRLEKDRLALSLSRLRNVYSDNLIEVTEWCMSLDPLSRPQSVFALQKELSRETERRYTKLSFGERLKLQIEGLKSGAKA